VSNRSQGFIAPPQLLVLGGIASVQFGAALANKLFAQAGPTGVVMMRLAFSAVLLLVVVRPRLTGRRPREWWLVLAFGVVLAMMNWSFYEAINLIPLGVAVTIEFIGPLIVAVAGSRRLLDLVWIGLAGGGVTLLGLGDAHGAAGSANGRGLLLAAIAGLLWGCYILLSQRVGAAFSGLDGLAPALAIGAVLLIPAGVIQGGDALLRPGVLIGGIAVSLLSSVIPYSLELTALRRLSAAAFGLLMSLEPAVAALAGVLVLGQALYLRTSLALAMVIAASVGTTLAARRRSNRAVAGRRESAVGSIHPD
jgi:inner membrane transporter RhtA